MRRCALATPPTAARCPSRPSTDESHSTTSSSGSGPGCTSSSTPCAAVSSTTRSRSSAASSTPVARPNGALPTNSTAPSPRPARACRPPCPRSNAIAAGPCSTAYPQIPGAPGCERLIDQVVDKFGHLNILVNNAGKQFPQDDILNISADQLHETFATNFFGLFHMSKATRLNSSHVAISYAVFCLKKKRTA